MNPLQFFRQLMLRFRYPVSLPEEIAEALGVNVTNSSSFHDVLRILCSPSCKPQKLTRFMPREQAERAFFNACRKERFHRNSLYSYYFNEGWVEFVLQFDDQSRLRRIYIQHKEIAQDQGIELPLN